MKYQTLHWRVFNIFGRIIGFSACIVGAAFLLSAGIYFVLPDEAGAINTRGINPVIVYLGGAIFALAMGAFFLRNPAYRPDLEDGAGRGGKRAWWTGDRT